MRHTILFLQSGLSQSWLYKLDQSEPNLPISDDVLACMGVAVESRKEGLGMLNFNIPNLLFLQRGLNRGPPLKAKIKY